MPFYFDNVLGRYIRFFVSANFVKFKRGVSMDSVAFITSWFAFSFPTILLCPGFHMNEMIISKFCIWIVFFVYKFCNVHCVFKTL